MYWNDDWHCRTFLFNFIINSNKFNTLMFYVRTLSRACVCVCVADCFIKLRSAVMHVLRGISVLQGLSDYTMLTMMDSSRGMKCTTLSTPSTKWWYVHIWTMFCKYSLNIIYYSLLSVNYRPFFTFILFLVLFLCCATAEH